MCSSAAAHEGSRYRQVGGSRRSSICQSSKPAPHAGRWARRRVRTESNLSRACEEKGLRRLPSCRLQARSQTAQLASYLLPSFGLSCRIRYGSAVAPPIAPARPPAHQPSARRGGMRSRLRSVAIEHASCLLSLLVESEAHGRACRQRVLKTSTLSSRDGWMLPEPGLTMWIGQAGGGGRLEPSAGVPRRDSWAGRSGVGCLTRSAFVDAHTQDATCSTRVELFSLLLTCSVTDILAP